MPTVIVSPNVTDGEEAQFKPVNVVVGVQVERVLVGKPEKFVSAQRLYPVHEYVGPDQPLKWCEGEAAQPLCPHDAEHLLLPIVAVSRNTSTGQRVDTYFAFTPEVTKHLIEPVEVLQEAVSQARAARDRAQESLARSIHRVYRMSFWERLLFLLTPHTVKMFEL